MTKLAGLLAAAVLATSFGPRAQAVTILSVFTPDNICSGMNALGWLISGVAPCILAAQQQDLEPLRDSDLQDLGYSMGDIESIHADQERLVQILTYVPEKRQCLTNLTSGMSYRETQRVLSEIDDQFSPPFIRFVMDNVTRF